MGTVLPHRLKHDIQGPSLPLHAHLPALPGTIPQNRLVDPSKGQANPCLCAFGYTVLCLNCFSLI